MDLGERALDAQERVAQAHRGVGEAAGIHDRGVEVAPLEPVDEGALVVRLEEGDIDAEVGRPGGDAGIDLGQRLPAVDRRLAGAQQVEVRPVKDQNVHGWRRSRITESHPSRRRIRALREA